MVPFDPFATDSWQPWLVATATGGVIPLAIAVMCVSGAVMIINSGSNKNLYSFFSVQMALCDFFMAIGPMILFVAMVTGKIELKADEATHFGCLTAVVLSYTTSDISATMLVLYVVAAYYHIYYINVSWHQAQISKNKLQWGSHIVFLVLSVLNMYVLDTPVSVRHLCTSLLPASMFGHTAFILGMLTLAWVGVLICACPIFITFKLPSLGSCFVKRGSLPNRELIESESSLEFESAKFLKVPLRYRRLRLEDIMEERSPQRTSIRTGVIPPKVKVSSRRSDESFLSISYSVDSPTGKPDVTERGQVKRNLIHLLNTPEGRFRVDGLSQVLCCQFKWLASRQVDETSETPTDEVRHVKQALVLLSQMYPIETRRPSGIPRFMACPFVSCKMPDTKSLHFIEVNERTESDSDTKVRNRPSSTGQQQQPQDIPDSPVNGQSPRRQSQGDSTRRNSPKPVASVHSSPGTPKISLGDDSNLRQSVNMGQPNRMTECLKEGEITDRQSTRGSGAGVAHTTTVPDSTAVTDPSFTLPIDREDSSCTSHYVDMSSRCTQTDSHDLNSSLRRSRKKRSSGSFSPKNSESDTPALPMERLKGGISQKADGDDSLTKKEIDEGSLGRKYFPLPRKRSPSADSVMPNSMSRQHETIREMHPFFGQKHNPEGTKHRKKYSRNVRGMLAVQTKSSGPRSAGDYNVEESPSITSLGTEHIPSILSSWADDDSVQIEAIQAQRRQRHAELLSQLPRHSRAASWSSLTGREKEVTGSAGDSNPLKFSKSQESYGDREQANKALRLGPGRASKGRQQKRRRWRWRKPVKPTESKISTGSGHWLMPGPEVHRPAQNISARGRLVFWRLLALVCVHSMFWLPAMILSLVSTRDITQPLQVALLLVAWLRPLVGSSLLLWFTLN